MSAVSWPEISEGVAVGGREFVWQSGGTLTVFRKNGGTLTGTLPSARTFLGRSKLYARSLRASRSSTGLDGPPQGSVGLHINTDCGLCGSRCDERHDGGGQL